MKFVYEDTFTISHVGIGWFIGLLTGMGVMLLGNHFGGATGIVVCAVLVFVSLQVVKIYNQWVERSTSDQ